MEASVIDPFPSVSAALADARRLDDQDLCDAIRDAEMALRAPAGAVSRCWPPS
ncbi:MAG: hypothetical protein V9G09_03565 [Candidatus Nanopelagicales bacterium]